MPQTEKYQGWTNYETWAVNLWIANDEPSYNYWRERTYEIIRLSAKTTYLSEEEVASHELADQLKEEHEDSAPCVSGVYADLLNAALSEVNWHEIAVSMVEDHKE